MAETRTPTGYCSRMPRADENKPWAVHNRLVRLCRRTRTAHKPFSSTVFAAPTPMSRIDLTVQVMSVSDAGNGAMLHLQLTRRRGPPDREKRRTVLSVSGSARREPLVAS
jgi:hypothetical protein